MSVISYLLLISPLKVLHCLHWVLNLHSLGMSLDLTTGLTFQPPEEGWSVQWLKRDKHGNKDEDNSPKNVNNVHNPSSQILDSWVYSFNVNRNFTQNSFLVFIAKIKVGFKCTHLLLSSLPFLIPKSLWD